MAKLPEELDDGGLGDITGVMNNQSVSDYRWLDVDPEEYRKFEALPKQNFDIIPDLVEYLIQEPDERVPSLVVQRPINVVNSNPLDTPNTPSRSSVVENLKKKIASFTMMNLPPSEIQKRLTLEYSPEQLRSAASEIREIVEERGLLGNVYINASHFSKCHQPTDSSKRFVARFASNAKFVLAKDGCTNCVCNKSGQCSSFKKRIVSSVPYNRETLGLFVNNLVRERRVASNALGKIPNDEQSIKSLLRQAFRTTPITHNPEQVQVAHHKRPELKPSITDSDVQAFLARQNSAKPETLAPHVLSALKSLSYGSGPNMLLASSDSSVRELSKEYGIVGHTYIDVDAVGGPAATLAFIKNKSLSPDFLVMRQSCEASDPLMSLIHGYEIFSQRPDLNVQNLKSALKRAVTEKRMNKEAARIAWKKVQTAFSIDFDKIISQVNLHQPEIREKSPQYTAPKLGLYHGDTSTDINTSVIVIPEEVRRTISHLMNTGLCGSRLKKVILSRYTKRDLSTIPEVGATLSSADGIQGFYYIDPTAYADYGNGCNSGSKALKNSVAANILACHKCTGCKLQTAPGWCSKYAKKLARSVPDSALSEAKIRISLPIAPKMERVEDPVEKYQLSSELSIDMDGSKSNLLEISIPSGDISD